MSQDSELDEMGRVQNSDGCGMGTHEWSEWRTLLFDDLIEKIDGTDNQRFNVRSPIKIRICKRCKQLQGDLV